MVGKQLPIGEKTGKIVPSKHYKKTWKTKKGKQMVLAKHNGNMDVILTLPAGLKTGDLSWLSIWCRKDKVDMGHVNF